MPNENYKKGFTTIELFLVVAIIVLIGGISAPVYQNFQVRNNIDLATEDTVHALRRAQILSQSVEGDSPWGVYVTNGSVTIFKGANFSGRDVVFDEVFDFPDNITPGGDLEIIYSKMYGNPQGTFPIIINFTSHNGDTRDIFINEKGMVEY